VIALRSERSPDAGCGSSEGLRVQPAPRANKVKRRQMVVLMM
jgi:hypothetical protein